MRLLSIKNFSCIKHANVEFGRVTVIIGPQASGKSVICKLSYFFLSLLREQNKFIAKNSNFESFKEHIKEKFAEWFPVSAWGSEKFKIEFTAGNYKITLLRTSYRSKVNDQIRITISSEFEEHYKAIRTHVVKVSEKLKNSRYDFEVEWRIGDMVQKSTSTVLGKDNIASQVFIPAGRSFFTSIGKAIAAFEQGKVLDPLILQFGRMFTSYKEHSRYYLRDEAKRQMPGLDESLKEILGGTVITVGDIEYLECIDNRRVPLTSLSSGQQEILPLATVLPHLLIRGHSQCLYIEEPEAHLFPSAQSKLIALLMSFVNISSTNTTSTNIVLTTHSPYVLVKINNLIKAGQLGRSTFKSKQAAVQEIIPRNAWLNGKNVKAYAICDGILKSIKEDNELIEADYLDDVSSEISKEFLKLLQIEVTNYAS